MPLCLKWNHVYTNPLGYKALKNQGAYIKIVFKNSNRHGTLRSVGPGGGVRPVGDGREERSRLQLGALSPDSTGLDLYYNPRPPSDHSTWR